MRHSLLPALAAALVLTAPARAEDPHAGHGSMAQATTAAPAARDQRLPAGEEDAKAALDTSPRHGEFVDIPLAGGAAPLRAWVVYPERRDKAGVVVLIHEIFGLSDWIRATADQLAREGFIAVAPDLLSGLGPGGGGTESVASRDDVVKLVREITPELAQARLDAAFEYGVHLPASNGKAACIGFCWGGTRSFVTSATRPGLRGAVVYYGTSPDSALLARVNAPVLGFYGGDDARVNATIAPARQALARLHRPYETHVFEGAGHGFLRQQSGREGANLRAARQAWPRTVEFLRRQLR